MSPLVFQPLKIMKISKLFHWLYASLMLLPLVAIISKCLYVTFNDNAFESYYGDTINDEQYIRPQSIILNTKYYIQYSYDERSSAFNNVQLIVDDFEDKTNVFNVDDDNVTRIVIGNISGTYPQITLYNQDTLLISKGTANIGSQNSINLSFVITNFNNTTALSNFLSTNKLYYIEYNQYSYIDNAFEYSVFQVTQSPLFSWAYDSFLSAPFVYILDLFGVPSTHVMVELLSYWLSVSIIWLVFDLIMYVPLLMHRWIDKGVLE